MKTRFEEIFGDVKNVEGAAYLRSNGLPHTLEINYKNGKENVSKLFNNEEGLEYANYIFGIIHKRHNPNIPFSPIKSMSELNKE